MTTQVMVTFPDDVHEWVEQLARTTGRTPSDVLSSVVGASMTLDTLSHPVDVAALTNDEVMTLAESRMDVKQNAHLSALLAKNQERDLDAVEELELSLLMYVYEQGSLRKADALVEAVKRGLRPPLSP